MHSISLASRRKKSSAHVIESRASRLNDTVQHSVTKMRARLIDRMIAILLTLLAGSEAGLASNDLASGHDPRMGSAQVFTSAQSARIVIADTQMAALNAVEEPFASLGLHFTEGPLAQIWQDVKVRVLADMARLALCAAQEAFCSPAARTVRNIVAEARSRSTSSTSVE